jgi:hypothetical protein
MNYMQAAKQAALAGTPLSDSAKAYLIGYPQFTSKVLKVSPSMDFSTGSFTRIGKSYTEFEARMANITGKSEEITAYRGIRKERILTDGTLSNTHLSDVFGGNTYYSFVDSGRYSRPGEIAGYLSIGTKQIATEIIEAELGKTRNFLHIDSRQLKLEKVLDLCDPGVLKHLGVTKQQLIFESNYEITHQLGNLARRYGFDAIKVPSFRLVDGTNIVLLRWPIP